MALNYSVWPPASSTDELEQPRAGLAVHGLHERPEPLDLFTRLGVVTVDRVPLPVLHVNLLPLKVSIGEQGAVSRDGTCMPHNISSSSLSSKY